MARILPGTAWTVFLYGATVATAGIPIGPHLDHAVTAEQIMEGRILFEGSHVFMHAGAFAILAWLLVMTQPAYDRAWLLELLVILFYVAVAVGLGQEAIQAWMRQQVHLMNSSLDILSDAAGAWLGLRVYYGGVWRRLIPMFG
jgi:hypothetical protein